jgi:two-component system chemotaxis response regulator CheY
MRVLIADDDKLCAEFMGAFVAAAGHEVVGIETAGGVAVLQSFQRHRPDCLLLDLIMPRLNGFTIASHLRSRSPDAKIIFMSGLVTADHPWAQRCQPDGWLSKPVAFEELCAVLSRTAESLTAAA